MNEEADYKVSTSRMNWRERLIRAIADPIEILPERQDSRTYLTTQIYSRISWRDRLTVLLSGRAHVLVRTYTDVEVKNAESISVIDFL